MLQTIKRLRACSKNGDSVDNAQLEKILADKSILKVVQMAPSVRVSIGDSFGYAPGTPLTTKLIGAFRELGFDYVFDTTFAADIVVMEEDAELEHRVMEGGVLPLMNSCCPGFVINLRRNFPELAEKNMATTKSPMEIMGTLIKTYFAENHSISPKRIYSVAVMPCLVKKLEAKDPRMHLDGDMNAVDLVLTTVEFVEYMKFRGLDLWDCPESDFDLLMGQSSGAARLFGVSGGVSAATIRYHARRHNRTITEPEVMALQGFENTRELKFKVSGKTIKILIIDGIQNAEPILKDKDLIKRYHFIEVMNCRGGCIGGAGQPPATPEVLEKRKEGLYALEERATYSDSAENPAAKQIYDDYLGEVGGKKAKQLLHLNEAVWEAHE
jgi:iron-only hydrogenase group A